MLFLFFFFLFVVFVVFFFNDTATTEIYTLSLHDALPIWIWPTPGPAAAFGLAMIYAVRRRRTEVVRHLD